MPSPNIFRKLLFVPDPGEWFAWPLLVKEELRMNIHSRFPVAFRRRMLFFVVVLLVPALAVALFLVQRPVSHAEGEKGSVNYTLLVKSARPWYCVTWGYLDREQKDPRGRPLPLPGGQRNYSSPQPAGQEVNTGITISANPGERLTFGIGTQKRNDDYCSGEIPWPVVWAPGSGSGIHVAVNS
jgi:hypothetical protein